MPLADRLPDRASGGFFFFNFNQGLPALAALRGAGFDVYLVYPAFSSARPPGIHLRYAYMRLRLRMVAMVCGNHGIGTGGARERIAQTIADGGLVCVAADTPPRPGTGLVPVRFPGDRPAWWRSGVLKLALQLPGPRRSFTVKLDWATRVLAPSGPTTLTPTERLSEVGADAERGVPGDPGTTGRIVVLLARSRVLSFSGRRAAGPGLTLVKTVELAARNLTQQVASQEHNDEHAEAGDADAGAPRGQAGQSTTSMRTACWSTSTSRG